MLTANPLKKRKVPFYFGLGWQVSTLMSSMCGDWVSLPGALVRPHTHPGHEILLLLEGQVSVDVGNETQIFESGEIVLIPADTPMAIVNTAPGQETQLLQILLAELGSPLKEKVSE